MGRHQHAPGSLVPGGAYFLSAPPFVHTKLFVMDEQYAQIGSANLDPRSLRLNFELTVEIYDRNVATQLAAHIEEQLRKSTPVTLESVRNRPFIIKMRDAVVWLFSSYL